MRYALIALAATLAASAAQAHEPRPGPNGGTLVDAGAHHVELVATDTSVEVYLSDVADAPVSSDGFKGTAILLVGGKPQRVALEPAGGSLLTGQAAAPIPAPARGAVQLTGPDGTTSQAKFN